jgi:diguanylate cyclase (GGDEF)-like protein
MKNPVRERILCVDDEPEVLNGLALHLRRHYDLITATSGAAALDLLSDNSDVAVIMSDMRMPGMSGAEFLARSRRLAPDAQRILLTGQTDLASAIAAINEGQICRFLTKPCGPSELLGAVADAVRLHNARDLERSGVRKDAEHRQSQVDGLTGLASRQYLLGFLESSAFRCAQDSVALDAYFVEIDASEGPEIGSDLPWADEVALIMAGRLKQHFTQAMSLARWGVEQFVAILPATGLGDSDVHANAEALSRVLKSPIVRNQESETVGISIGIARLTDPLQWHRLIQHASMAARQARRDAGSGVCLYRQDAPPQAEKQRALLRALRQAIDTDALQVHYQPIVDTNRRSVRGLECLARWQHSSLGNVPPATFIPLAEESGDILRLGRGVLWKACHEGQAFAQEHPLTLCVNVSPKQFLDPDFLQHLKECLAHSGLPPNSLELEVTETAFAGDVARLRDTLVCIRNLGVRLAIDDFGSGYSSLAYLAQLPIDVIKVDRVFVRDFEHGGVSVIRAALSLAADLDRELVIEGVETHEMLIRLKSLGATFIQGYIFSKPLPARGMSTWLRSFQYPEVTAADGARLSGVAGP